MIFTIIRILFFLVDFLVSSHGLRCFVGSDPKNYASPKEYSGNSSDTGVAAIQEQTDTRDIASSWCSAYRTADSERLAALETQEIEIVDRFGDWHHLIGLKARQSFWADGLDMTSRRDFLPECTVQHVRLIGLNTATAQVKVSYDEGILLKDGDRVPPFSEIHTLVLVRVKDTWLVSAHDIVQRHSGD